MTRQSKRATTRVRPKTPLAPFRRSADDRALARSALLARRVLAAGPEKEPVPEVPHWPLLGSMLVH